MQSKTFFFSFANSPPPSHTLSLSLLPSLFSSSYIFSFTSRNFAFLFIYFFPVVVVVVVVVGVVVVVVVICHAFVCRWEQRQQDIQQ